MKIFHQIYEQLSKLFANPKNKQSDQMKFDEIYSCGISFFLKRDNTLEMSCLFPKDIDSMDASEIAEMAERYSEMILYLNKGLFKSDILETIVQLDDNTSANKTLFVTNITKFYELLNSEYSKIAKNNGPLIDPVSVFRA